MSDAATAERPVLPYDLAGGEAGLRQLVDRFYALMEREPAFGDLRALHGADLAPMRQRLFEFLSGWTGGPRLFDACVMGAHRNVAIGERERDQWLTCMARAMVEEGWPAATQNFFAVPLARMAEAMRNR